VSVKKNEKVITFANFYSIATKFSFYHQPSTLIEIRKMKKVPPQCLEKKKSRELKNNDASSP